MTPSGDVRRGSVVLKVSRRGIRPRRFRGGGPVRAVHGLVVRTIGSDRRMVYPAKACCRDSSPDMIIARGPRPHGKLKRPTEVIRFPQLCFFCRDAHPHRQLQVPLGSHCGINRTPRRGERGTHTVTGVLEQPAPERLDRLAQHLVMGGQRHPHPLGVRLPPTGRTLHIAEQKRHHPRRSSRPRSRHPCSISQQTGSYLVHRRIRPGQRIDWVLRRTSASRRCRLFRDKLGLPPDRRRHVIASAHAICPSKPSVLAMSR